jgi:hypothetical protein
MKKENKGIADELRDEYDFQKLKLRKAGPGRRDFSGATVRIEKDVFEVFPDSESVNHALRFLIRVTKMNSPDFLKS